MYGSGAGTGMEAIRVVVRLTLPASPRALSVCIAAAAGTIVRLAAVRLFGAAAFRLAGTAFLVSALSGAPSSAGKRERKPEACRSIDPGFKRSGPGCRRSL